MSIRHVEQKISKEKRCSKRWWSLNAQLLRRKCKNSGIPALRKEGQWIHNAQEKANLFATTWKNKSTLIPMPASPPIFVNTQTRMSSTTILILVALVGTRPQRIRRVGNTTAPQMTTKHAQTRGGLCMRCWL